MGLDVMSGWVEAWGESTVLVLGGLLIGAAFGFFAQRSKFCLRAAVVELARGALGGKLAVWLISFFSALLLVQLLVVFGGLDVASARQISARGSLSGAILGGLLFGIGMVLTRGCASRLLVLSAQGNLRALLSGLIFAVTAQAALSGVLSPLRLEVSSWWTVEGGASRDLLALLGYPVQHAWVLGVLGLLLAFWVARRARLETASVGLSAVGVGASVAAAWGYTQWVARSSFESLQIQGITFSGPSAEWLMRILHTPTPAIGFDFGLLPGVFIGSFIAALLGGELKLEGFQDGYTMRRYLLGAPIMGFGAMLAGGCAVGAGITGGAIFALTAWITLLGMWLGAGLTDRLVDASQNIQSARAA